MGKRIAYNGSRWSTVDQPATGSPGRLVVGNQGRAEGQQMTSRVAARWAAVKAAVHREYSRIHDEYYAVRDQVLAQCGQDVRHTIIPIGAGGELVWVWHEADRAWGPDIAVSVSGYRKYLRGLDPAKHWPGRVACWEAVLASLQATNAASILAAWEKKEEEAA
jgi:hypothetical protein